MDSTSAASGKDTGGSSVEQPVKASRYYRRRMEYCTMKTDRTVYHRSNPGKLPEETTVIKVLHRYSYKQVRSIVEHEYEKDRLSAGQIKACRQNFKTKEIIIKIRSKLDTMLSDVHPSRGELMEKALNYLNIFRTQLFAYTMDSSYTIDNFIAERFMLPLAGERKNSLFFGSG